MVFVVVFIVLLIAELFYFKIANKFNIIDKPNQRSSHSTIVLRGGGIIFSIAIVIWLVLKVIHGEIVLLEDYWGFVVGVLLIATISFVDDIKSLPDSVRLVAQFIAMGLVFYSLDILHLDMWWVVLLALIVCVGATNIYNFMDGINGITAGYSLAVLLPLIILNTVREFMDMSLLIVVGVSLIVFCIFNFRQRGKAKCFAGDVGSVAIAFIILFCIGKLVMFSGDISWLGFLIVYGVDGCMTIAHRIQLHENLGEAHRKHAYQLMANELKMSHPVVSCLYMALQLSISLVMIYFVPDNVLAHWVYLGAVLLLLIVAYVLFMKKYYHLHEEYLESLKSR